MWFQSSLKSQENRPSRQPSRRARHTADRRRETRKLLLEGLEDRSLLAFNVLAEYATGDYPLDLVLTQINNADSQPDMVVANYYGGDVSVRLGNAVDADGTFGDAQNSAAGLYPHSVATGDFNGGGVPDLVTANSSDVSLMLGNGDGWFGAPQSISLPPQTAPGNPDTTPLDQYPRSVATGDINSDGKLDLVVLGTTTWYYCYWSCYAYQDGYVNVLLGDGTGGFAAPDVHHLGTNNYPSTVAVGDVNGDLMPDVITANNGYYTSGLTVLLNEAVNPGELGSPVHSGSGYALPSISLGDVDGDGNVDTLLSGGDGLYVQKGDGAGGFTAQPYLNAGGYVNSAVIGDVNDDGKMDLVTAGADNWYTCTSWGYWGGCYAGYWTSSRHASVLIGNGAGAFSLPLTSSLGSEWGYDYLADLAIADLTGDDKPELVTIDPYFDKAIVAVNDGDWNPPPSISISDAATVVEGDSGTVNAVFTVTIVGDHGDVSVNYATSDGSAVGGATEDYAITSGTLNFSSSQFSQTFSVPVNGDMIDEDLEQFYVSLSNASGGQITDTWGVGTIQDDDTDPVLSISGTPTVLEGDGGGLNAVFTVTLEGDRKGGVVTVDYSTFDSGAVAGADYTATSGKLTFAVDEPSKEISVPILGDTIDEYDEQFYVGLSNPVKAQISDSYDIGTIQDNDAAPSITINDVSRNEGNNRHDTSFVFTVSLSEVSGKYVSVNYSTEDGTATVSGSDYYATSGTVYIAPGTMTGTFTVTVRGDKAKEPNETFKVNLSNPVEGTISKPQGIGTIVNDDGGRGKPTSSLETALLLDDTVSTIRKRR